MELLPIPFAKVEIVIVPIRTVAIAVGAGILLD